LELLLSGGFSPLEGTVFLSMVGQFYPTLQTRHGIDEAATDNFD
jgi:hypothetical protein